MKKLRPAPSSGPDPITNPDCHRTNPNHSYPVSTVQEIKLAIEQLPLEARAALVSELCGWSDDDWDRRMQADAQAGRFAVLNEEAANPLFRGPLVGAGGGVAGPRSPTPDLA